MTDPRGERPELRSVGGDGAAVRWVAVLLVAAVAIGVAKPWNLLPAAAEDPFFRSTPSAVTAVFATPDPTLMPNPPASPPPNAIECREPDGWRLATLNGEPGNVTRSWTVIEPTTASGPADSALASQQVTADGILELGFCATHQTSATAAAIVVSGWQRDSLGHWQMVRMFADPLGGAADASEGGYAVLYGPPNPARSVAWPTGDYVFHVQRGASSAWFRLDLVWPPRYLGAVSTVGAGAAP